MKQVTVRLADEAYGELARRAGRLGRKVTSYLQDVLAEAARSPAQSESIVVAVPEELRVALVGIGRELGTTPAGVMVMAADLALDQLTKRAVEVRSHRQEAATTIGPQDPGRSGRPKRSDRPGGHSN